MAPTPLLFDKLFALLLAFKKLIAIGVIGLGSLLFKRWRNKDSGSQPAVDLSKH